MPLSQCLLLQKVLWQLLQKQIVQLLQQQAWTGDL